VRDCRTTTLLSAPFQNPVCDEIEVVDPTHPLFGRRFAIRNVSRAPGREGFVDVVYREAFTLRIRLSATNLWDRPLPGNATKWTMEAVSEFLALFQEVTSACDRDSGGAG
jgi:hypothetical protein